MPSLQSGSASDRPKTTETTFPPIVEFVWQQLLETKLFHLLKNANIGTHKNDPSSILKQRDDTES